MVLINGVKYACERCIRGHRVTTCNHTDQPLMMIKPKGRPSTTCDHCKELRKNKNANPSGVCTCGRLEKKRLVQRAKEEARAKAKEEKMLHECRCGSDEPCKCHSNRRSRNGHGRKLKNIHTGSRPPSQHMDSSSINGGLGHVMSPVSMDSSSSMLNGSTSNSSNINVSSKTEFFPLSQSGFLDTGEFNGKVSKDYHQVPSLASISSLHSGQSSSFDQKVGLPQSPLLNGFSRSSVGNFFNWADEVGSVYSAKSNSGVNLPEQNSDDNNDSHKNSNIAGDLGMGSYFFGSDSTNRNDSGSENKNKRNSKPQNRNTKVPFDEYFNPSGVSMNLNSDSNAKINNSSSPLDEWIFDKSPNPSSNNAAGSINDNSMNFLQNGGLLDMYADSTVFPTFGKSPLMGQQNKFDTFPSTNSYNPKKTNPGININTDSGTSYKNNSDDNDNDDDANKNNNKNNSNSNNNNINDDKSNMNNIDSTDYQYQNKTWASPSGPDRSDTASVDGGSVRSFEDISLTPSFIDIPEKFPGFHNHHSVMHPHQQHNQQPKQIRRSGSSKSYRNQPSTRAGVPITINPSVVSSIDDTISTTSLQSPTGSIADTSRLSTSLSNGGDYESSNTLPERSKSPRLGLSEVTNSATPASPQLFQQPSSIFHPTSAQSEIDQLLEFDTGNTSGVTNNSVFFDANNNDKNNTSISGDKNNISISRDKNNNSNRNLLFQNDIPSPVHSGVLQETSPTSSNQMTSPPSQLLTEKGFADLDDFMSTL